VTDEELIARVREWVGQDGGAYDLAEPLEALDTLARRLEELKDGLERIEQSADSEMQDEDESAAYRAFANEVYNIARSLLHPEPQGEGQHDTTHIKHSHPGEIVPQNLEES
jgi:hypothetical protein